MKPEDLEKTNHKKMATLYAFFRRLSNSGSRLLPDTQTQPATTPRRELFGRPLEEICHPDFPPPLMELLEQLYNLGPYTREIFRKPSNAKRCREMVEVMNSKSWQEWLGDCRNGLTLASILKMYLRELPGKLCVCQMYPKWAKITQVADDFRRIDICRRLVIQLPQLNRHLLKYIICILHYIQKRSEENLMTSSNLAVCVGPSLLWTDSDNLHELESTSRIVPQVVQLMIDRCTDIFGADVLDMFGHPPRPVSGLPCDFSVSIDSISDIKLSLQQMSPSSMSRDSGLLSDTMEDAEPPNQKQQLAKSASCDSVITSHSFIKHSVDGNLSSDSLNCDDNYLELELDSSSLVKQSEMPKSLNEGQFAKKPLQLVNFNGTSMMGKQTAAHRGLSLKSHYERPPNYNSEQALLELSSKAASDIPKVSRLSSRRQSEKVQSTVDLPGEVVYDHVLYRHINSLRRGDTHLQLLLTSKHGEPRDRIGSNLNGGQVDGHKARSPRPARPRYPPTYSQAIERRSSLIPLSLHYQRPQTVANNHFAQVSVSNNNPASMPVTRTTSHSKSRSVKSSLRHGSEPSSTFFQPRPATPRPRVTATQSLSCVYRPGRPPLYKDIMRRRSLAPDFVQHCGPESFL